MTRQLMKGNEAIAKAAIEAGCKAYFGYPITPQSECLEYMAAYLQKAGGAFVQTASELEAINMIYGAAAAGVRCMTSSSSPGISLMQEGISYLACGGEHGGLPCVIVNIVRGGPGLGGIQPAQSDFYQAVHGGGHGDYRTIVLAPGTVQEAVDLMMLAFDLADLYLMPVIVLSDGMLGQMAEAVEFKQQQQSYTTKFLPPKNWALRGALGRNPNKIIPFDLDPYKLEERNLRLQATYEQIKAREVRFKKTNLDNPDIVLVAYGTVGRIAKTVVEDAAREDIKVGLIRPITLWPFPQKVINYVAGRHRKDFLVVEMSLGQMIDEVKLAVDGQVSVHFLGRTGGVVPTQSEILNRVREICGRKSKRNGKKTINIFAAGKYLASQKTELEGMDKIRSRPESLTDKPFSYCPGCGHSIAHRLVAEVIDELSIREKTIGVFCVGCAVFGPEFFNLDSTVPAHGRAPAVATGIKRVVNLKKDNPDAVVFAYQGDGDLAAIGLTETVHTANRGEPITIIFVNNTVFAMTGGQMAPTTLEGQVTSTTTSGRDVETTGYPIRVSEMLDTLKKPAYIARVALTSPKNIMTAKKAIKRAFQLQLEGKYSFVEILSPCPTNWRLSPEESLRFVDEKMAKEFPLGVLRDVVKEGEV